MKKIRATSTASWSAICLHIGRDICEIKGEPKGVFSYNPPAPQQAY